VTTTSRTVTLVLVVKYTALLLEFLSRSYV